MAISADVQKSARDLLTFIDASPSPWHAVATAAERLNQQGFEALSEATIALELTDNPQLTDLTALKNLALTKAVADGNLGLGRRHRCDRWFDR